jgi:hypothetical protein
MCLFPCTSSLIFPQTFCSEALRSLISRTGPPPQSTFESLFLLPWTFRSKLAYQGFRPSSRHHRPASTCTGASQAPVTFRPQAFSASRRFAPQSGWRACSISPPRPGFSPVQGVLSSCSLSFLIGKSGPHAVSPVSAHRPKSAATSTRPGFEALLYTRQRCLRLGFTLPVARSPPRVPVPSGR